MISYNGKPIILFERGGRRAPGAKGATASGILTDQQAAKNAAEEKLARLQKTDPKGRETKNLEARKKAEESKGGPHPGEQRNGQGEGKNPTMEEIWKALGFEDPEKAYEESLAFSDKTPSTVNPPKVGVDLSQKAIDAKIMNEKRLYMKNDSLIASLTVSGSLYGIGGMPAHFIHNCDPPASVNKGGVGAFYLKNYVTYGQFISFQPGYIKFGISGDEAAEIVNNGANASATLSSIGAKIMSGEVTQFQLQLDTYWLDVERACRIATNMMGISKMPLTLPVTGHVNKANRGSDRKGNQSGGNDWLRHSKNNTFNMGEFRRRHWRTLGVEFSSMVANKNQQGLSFGTGNSKDSALQDLGTVGFFVDGNIEPSMSLTNSVGDSPLKEALEGLIGKDTSDMLKMILGRVGLQGSATGTNILSYLTGNPLFPQIWQATTFEKSYSVNMKFSSHAGDPISVFMNVIYPLIKFAVLALPIGVGGFQTSPAILKVYSSGAINTEYGMITTFNINRHMETATDTGLPTEVDIQATVVDMNPYLYKERPGWFKHTSGLGTGFSNFIATMIGINITTISSATKSTFTQAMIAIDKGAEKGMLVENISFAFNNFIDGMMASAGGTWSKWNFKMASTIPGWAGLWGGNANKQFQEGQLNSNQFIGNR